MCPVWPVEVIKAFPVRRQGFWNRWLRSLAERLAYLLVDLKRLDCGIANAVV